MIKLLSFLMLTLCLTISGLMAQSAKLNDVKSAEAPKIVNFAEEQTFYTDFKNRQMHINRMNKGALSAATDLIIENWDWPSNQFTPPHSFMFDLTGSGTLYPLTIETGNTLLNAAGDPERYAVFGFADDFGVATFLPYGLNTTGNPVRAGWNSHLLLDKENGKCYISIYDFLNGGVINNHLMEIDLLVDPSVAVHLTDPSTALEGGWPRIALDGNGVFWMTVDIAFGATLGVAASVDGGATFNLVDSVGSADPSFWGTAFGNDFGLMSDPNSEKVSFITKVTRAGSLAGLGIGIQGTTNPDSASGAYHWYSENGGSSWSGEWILYEGDPVISNRPGYEPTFIGYSTASYSVDPNGVTHFVMGIGPNTGGVVGTDTINVYPPVYWNDLNKEWIALELPEVEQYAYTLALMNWGNLPAARPVVKADDTGNIVVAMWNRVQFSGTPGASNPNIYTAAGETDFYHYDVVYAYSEDKGATWSDPIVAVSNTNNSSVYPMIAEIEIDDTVATLHFTYLWDKIPGSFIVGQNTKSTDNTYIYDAVTFTIDPIISVDDADFALNSFTLEQNYPNPFNPSTKIDYTISERSAVTLKVYDVLGNEVANLVNTTQEAGKHSVIFDAGNLASGLYIYTLNSGNFTSSRKMMLLK